MIKLKLEGKAYQIPDRFTVSQWMQLASYEFNEPMNHAKILSIVTGAPVDLLSEAPTEAIQLGISFIITVMDKRQDADNIVNNFEELKFGQWIDMEVYLSMGIHNYLNKMVDILSSGTEWADEALWIIDRYSEWRMSVYRSYKVLFGLDEVNTESDESDETQDRLSVAKSWYSILVDLSNDNLLEIDNVADKHFRAVFNFMAHRKEKLMKEAAQKLQQRRQHDLQRNRRPL